MKNRATKFVTAVVAGGAAGLALIALPAVAARAEECLAGPKGAAPHGSHWYYRVDRATKRNCWYVREAGPKTQQSVPTASSTTTVSTPPQTKPPTAAPLQPSIANARAEYTLAQDAPNLSATPPASGSAVVDSSQSSNPQAAGAQPWSLASRWSDQEGTTNQPASDATASQQVIAPDNISQPAAKSSATPAVQSTLGMLLGALAAALALAGVLVGAIIKFGSAKPTVKRDANGRPDIWGAAAVTNSSLSEDPELAIDESERSVPPMNWIRIARERHIALKQSDEIEELLARAPRRPA